ncbi:MAG TPA: enoyl-CoA hydratase-related protein [Candidatus Thermoplasmatota archaeon]|nr:enoyl-CoA hydratase-related protein [Candidatus Thermoplasmatota archaeon]
MPKPAAASLAARAGSAVPHAGGLVDITHHEGGVAVVQLLRAESMNSFDPNVVRALRKVFHGLMEDPQVRAMVLTGSGKAFSAGADVRAFERALAEGTSVQWVLDATGELHPLLFDLHGSDKPLVAAVNGVAAGGGLGLALVAEYRVGSPSARLAAGYFGLGLSPDGGSTWLLPRLVGEQRAKRFFFTNEVMDAQEALRCGALDEVVPEDRLLARAVEVARTFGAWARHSREATKRLLEAQSATGFAQQLDLERGLIAAAAGTRDFREGVQAFLAKRKPVFQ